MKNACGFDALRVKWILLEFDNFFVCEAVTELHIRKVHIEKWRTTRINDSEHTLYSKYSVWSQFCRYMCHIGIDCYVPRLPKQPVHGFTPFIFSHEQMKNIFQACDELRLYDRHMHVNILVIPTLIRLLYSTGLRISEALSILNEDVDFIEGVIRIKKTKNGEQRLAPLSQSMLTVLKEYIFQRNKIPVANVDRPGSFLFVSLTGKPCENGLDLYCALPLLSTFIGHKSISATEQYVRLTAEMYPQLINEQKGLCSYVFPVNLSNKNQ